MKRSNYNKKEMIYFFRCKLLNYMEMEKQRETQIYLCEQEINDRALKATNLIMKMLKQNQQKLTYEMMLLSYDVLFLNLDSDYATNVMSLRIHNS